MVVKENEGKHIVQRWRDYPLFRPLSAQGRAKENLRLRNKCFPDRDLSQEKAQVEPLQGWAFGGEARLSRLQAEGKRDASLKRFDLVDAEEESG